MNGELTIHFKRMSLLALKGTLESSLEETRSKLKNMRHFEVSQVQEYEDRDFIALFNTNHPILDITIDRYHSGDSSIVGISLGKKKLLPCVRKICSEIELNVLDHVDPYFLQTIQADFCIDMHSYRNCDEVSRLNNMDIKHFFSVTRYANFLANYQKYKPKTAMRTALERFS